MMYKLTVAAALAACAAAQGMDMPMPSGDMPAAAPAAAPAPAGDMPAADPAPGMSTTNSPPMNPAPSAGMGGMPPAMGAGMGMGHGSPMAGGHMPRFDNTTLSGQCQEIAVLTGFTRFAANETALNMAAAMIPLTPDQVTELKNNASMAADTLKTLESNTTLANTCAEVNEVTGTCMRFNGLMRLEELANNDTALAAFKARRNLTDDQVTRLKDFAKKESDNVDAMNNNVTLVTQCTMLKQFMKSGMSSADAALKAGASALDGNGNTVGTPAAPAAPAPPAAKEVSEPMVKEAKKNGAATIAASSFAIVAGIAAGIVFLA